VRQRKQSKRAQHDPFEFGAQQIEQQGTQFHSENGHHAGIVRAVRQKVIRIIRILRWRVFVKFRGRR